MLTRRHILKGLLLASGCSLLPLGRGGGWALAAPESANGRLVVVLLRGAMDGLSAVVPYGEGDAYYKLRPNIAIQKNDLADLNGFFGLHPALYSLKSLWDEKSLAFIHASGLPDVATGIPSYGVTRSHFYAQDILETAILMTTAGKTPSGWMNNLALTLPNNGSLARAISFGVAVPKIFNGSYKVATVVPGATPKTIENLVGGAQQEAAFSALYSDRTPVLFKLFSQGLEAQKQIASSLVTEMVSSAQNAMAPTAFLKAATNAATIMNNDPLVQTVFMDIGGWDTHVGQGTATTGPLRDNFVNLANGLTALVDGLKAGGQYDKTTILVMSEFGRRVSENGDLGSDHGHGNVAMVMGGRVNGGSVMGRWPGLTTDKLFQGIDLDVTTDFRTIIYRVLAGTFGLTPTQMATVLLGGFTPPVDSIPNLMKA